VLNIVHRTLEVKCKADAIPEEFTVDLSSGEIGSSFEAFAIQLPAGVKLTAQEDFTVATIVTPQEEVKEETPAQAAAPAADSAAAPAADAAAAPAEEKKEEKK